MKYLCNKGANYNIIARKSTTKNDILNLISKEGILVDNKNDNDSTALSLALSKGRLEIVEYLKEIDKADRLQSEGIEAYNQSNYTMAEKKLCDCLKILQTIYYPGHPSCLKIEKSIILVKIYMRVTLKKSWNLLKRGNVKVK